jgi:hypothetical protein
MNNARMYLDVPGEGFGRASYPFYLADNKQYLGIPFKNTVLSVDLPAPAVLESFFDGQSVDKRELAAGQHQIPLSDLVPLKAGQAYFQATAGGAEADEPARSTVYVFLTDYGRGYQENQMRQYREREAREEKRRMAAACPPPVAPATYQDLIDEQLRLARQAAEQASAKLTGAANLANHAAGVEVPPDQTHTSLLESAGENLQQAARLIAQSKQHHIYARYYEQEKQAHQS